MRELSLFTGAGGGLLGTHLLGWEPIGYVEWNEYCQQIIAARIRDGYLPVAPIFTDVREFVQSGAAEQYRGFADVVTAGFPCQPFSIAGKQLAADDERNMWPATRDIIRDARPKHVLLENVPGLLACGYAGNVIGDLAEMGYVGRWGCISASSQGAQHERERWWVIAHAMRKRLQGSTNDNSCGEDGARSRCAPRGTFEASLNTHSERGKLAQLGTTGRVGRKERFSRYGAWEVASEPFLRRGIDGMAHRMDRLRAIGNGQVPAVVRAAWELMS